MKISMQPYKGARDFYPEDMQLQQWMFSKWKRVVESYGYVEYSSPIIEPTDLYLMKGNEEIVNEQTYTFLDRGERSVTIRTEMTPSVTRMVAGRRQELAYPLRWYSIPNLWRYERMQRGRLREFWQLNVDMFGIDSNLAELEMIQIIDDLFQAFKARRSTYVIKINSRLLVTALLKELELSENQTNNVTRLIDKIKKLPIAEFADKLDEITGSKGLSESIVKILATSDLNKLPTKFSKFKSVITLKEIIKQSKSLGIDNLEFDMTLMRGFDYYTDVIFEVFDNHPENNRSVFGGGRYDGLVSQFGVDSVPTIGFGMGDVPFYNFLEMNTLIPAMHLATDLRVIIKDQESIDGANKAGRELREIGVKVAVDFSGRKFEKQMKTAIKSDVRYILIVGKDEIENEQFTLKDLKSMKDSKHSLARIASIVLDSRNNK